jgi:hypothetical protein
MPGGGCEPADIGHGGKPHAGAGQCEGRRATPDAVFIYIGTCPIGPAAQADYDVLKDLQAVGAVGSYDASVVTKDEAGKVHVITAKSEAARLVVTGQMIADLVILGLAIKIIMGAVSRRRQPGGASGAQPPEEIQR